VRGAGRLALVAALAAAPFLLLGLGAAPFDDPGEGMHAQIAREVRAAGDPLALSLAGVPYVDKPPLLYALIAGAFALAGESEAAARAVPALAALAAVGATAWLGARLLGGAWGLLAGGALLTSAGFFAYGRYVRPDALFVAALAWGFALALVGVVEERRGLVVAGLAAFGVAALAKDPLGAIAPPLAIGAALALAGRARPLARWLPPGGVLLAITLAFGWWVVVEARRPGFAWYTVVDNHLLNVARARHFPDEDVPLGAVQFLAIAAAGAAPWVVPAAVAVARLVRRRAWRDPREAPWVALGLWAAGVLGLTALSSFRLPHYGLPAYPAIALLAARAWRDARGGRLVAGHAVAFAAIAVACALAAAGGDAAFTRHVLAATDVATRKAAEAGQAGALPPWATFRTLLATTALVSAAGAVALATLRRAPAAPAVVLAAMLGLMPCVGIALAVVAGHRAADDIGREVGRRAAPGDIVLHEGPLENSGALEWYSGRRPDIVDGRRSVLGFGATLPGAGARFWDAERLRRAWGAERRVWVVTSRAPERSLAAALPGARLVATAGGRWLWVDR